MASKTRPLKRHGFMRSLQYVLLYMLLFVMAISYHPVIVNISKAAGYESGTILSRYILLIFGALFAVSLFRIPKVKSVLCLKYIVWLTLIAFLGYFIRSMHGNKEMLSMLRTFLIVLASIIIGWTLTPNSRQLSRIMLVFTLTVIFSGLMQVFMNIGGFVIADQYLTDSKNSLGAMLATCEVSFLFLFLSQEEKKVRLVALVFFLVGFIVILTIRARAALLSTVLLSGMFLALHAKGKKMFKWILVAIPLVLILFSFLPMSFGDYLKASISAGTQGDDVTSGRMGTYQQAIRFIVENPLLGDVENRTSIAWIHNFPLLNIYRFGLLYSWPILCLYLYIILHSLKYSIRTKMDFRYAGYTILIVPYIISLLEPTFPFGPGTVTVYNFILLGVAERFRVRDCSLLKTPRRRGVTVQTPKLQAVMDSKA